MIKTKLAAAAALLAVLAGCDDASVASHNLSKAADNFEINRRVVFYNGITGEYMLSIEGLCSLGSGQETKSVAVTCKTGPNQYKKHFLGISDNVTYFAEQLEAAPVNAYHYRVIFKPQTILPDVDLRGSASALGQTIK
ncbi:hypothetical protein [Pseudomonas typographi]|uniref:beta-sandwich lipoprotein n=1 Tax=Pseudomonas typographi TaxID=2715964 RepID=UPI0016876349|nr:hypothetical protein [Pseudomonas typographi]MBD1554673.1 hypothetical protein [Pseudomonas typographi]